MESGCKKRKRIASLSCQTHTQHSQFHLPLSQKHLLPLLGGENSNSSFSSFFFFCFSVHIAKRLEQRLSFVRAVAPLMESLNSWGALSNINHNCALGRGKGRFYLSLHIHRSVKLNKLENKSRASLLVLSQSSKRAICQPALVCLLESRSTREKWSL